jgi:hypothetical protein
MADGYNAAIDADDQDDARAHETAARREVAKTDAVFGRLKRWCRGDYHSKPQTTWRKEAREDFAFEAGEQLTEDDKRVLEDLKRPFVVFNMIGTTTDSVAGQEVANRQEVQFIPRTMGVVKANEMLTGAAKWFRQQCDAEDEESDAFRDTVVCGMGWTETRLCYEDDPTGKPLVDRVDPLEMVWDRGAKKRNVVDAKRVFHVRRGVPIDEARSLCPGDPDYPFDDADYNATWLDDEEEDHDEPHHEDGEYYDKDESDKQDQDASEKTVTLVRAQWWERVPAWLMVDPTNPDNIITLDQQGYDDLKAKAKIAQAPMPKCVRTTRKVYRQAYMGNVLLEIGDAPVKGHFSFKAMTGKRDRNKNTFYGIVRAMKDPARWANKWMSQSMHIMNTTAKGGIGVERGQFFDDDAQGEASWAQQDQVTYLKPGALSGTPKFIEKPQGQFPAATFQMMEYAVSMLPRVSGVNTETLGQAMDSGQAAALDRQRKQSVMIILQPLFDGLRRYRKEQGRVLLYLITHFLSDGRLIKIEGQENAQYVPLVRQEGGDAGQYDVIVDESPTSANQKEEIWATLQQVLPVIGKMLPPQVWLALLKYSPFPTSAQKDISDAMAQVQQQPNPDQQRHDAELKAQDDKAAADIENHRKLTDARIEGMRREADTKREVAVHAAQTDALTQALNAPQEVGPDGAALPNHGQQAAGLIMSVLGDLRRDMNTLAASLAALSAPKQLIRDPQTGEIVGIAPMGQQ